MKIRVANPIYDVVFKYLMTDPVSAKLLLSGLTGEEVVTLELKPTEHLVKVEPKSLTVFRVDFAARIRASDGTERLTLIEIQKAKLHTDIMRFRRYLGGHYQDANNTYQTLNKQIRALPIFSIYFLGHQLEHIDAPVIRVPREYVDAATGERLQDREVFIESLTHDSVVVQIPYLSGHRRTELEVLLSVFDQRQRDPEDRHYVELNEEDYPEAFRPVIRRLLHAAAEQEVREKMTLEDELMDELGGMERALEEKERALEEKERALEEKERARQESEHALQESEHALQEKEHALQEKTRMLERTRHRAMKALLDAGISEEAARAVVSEESGNGGEE